MLMVCWEVRITFSYSKSVWRGENFYWIAVSEKFCITRTKNDPGFPKLLQPFYAQLYVVACRKSSENLLISYWLNLCFLRLLGS